MRLDGIAVPAGRMRKLRQEKVDEIAESLPRGQIQPIVVRPDGAAGFILIAGHHRLEGARKISWQHIRAEVLEGLAADEAANLIRADLSPAERAMHLARRKELYDARANASKHGGDRRSAKAKSQKENLKDFVKETATKTGKGRSTVARDVTRGTKVAVLADIVRTSLDEGTELDALAGLSENEQHKLAARAKAGERVSARTRIKQVARQVREEKLGAKQRALPDRKYGVIVADPEWDDDVWSRETGMNKHPANHYPTSDPETIKSRPVESIAANDAILFLWSTNQHLRIAMDVLEAWCFQYASNYVWTKPSAGTGFWNRSRHENLLVGTRGNIPCPAPGTQWESVIEAPRPGDHSAKPDCFLEMIEQYFPNLRKIELNRRGAARPGWDAWGNEAEAAE